METEVTLRPPFGYPTWMIVVSIVLLVAVIAANVILRVVLPGKLELGRKRRNKETPQQQDAPYFNLEETKWRHISQLDTLRVACLAGQVDRRIAHEEISRVARSFVHEVTKVDVRDWTLAEIRRSPYASLAELIDICYEPEFAEHSETDPIRSIDHAKAVIWSWM
jgi:hypothetical protein